MSKLTGLLALIDHASLGRRHNVMKAITLNRCRVRDLLVPFFPRTLLPNVRKESQFLKTHPAAHETKRKAYTKLVIKQNNGANMEHK